MGENSPVGSEAEFEQFLQQFDTPEFRASIAAKTGDDPARISARLDTYFSEMKFGHRFLSRRIPYGRLRILEVGAGLGLLSIWLHRLGHEVVALEPAALAFGLFDATRREIWSACGENTPTLYEGGAETLTPEDHGSFDFIFSINVMEHIGALEEAFAAIAAVLRPGGVWLNSCPNYWIPYEPHYAIPMVPGAPGLTRRLFAGTIDPNPDTWDTLNFINWSTVRRLAAKNRLKAEFETGGLHDSLVRLGEDPEFLSRHRHGFVGRVYAVLSRFGLVSLTRHLPAALSTPMIFTLRRHAS